MIWLYTILSVLIVSLMALIGIFGLLIKRNLLEKITLSLVGFSIGALLGGAFLHLIPELSAENNLTPKISMLILASFVLFFIIEKFAHWHHCRGAGAHPHLRPVAYMILIGDGVHNFIDGIIIAGAYLVSIPLGIATTLAVVLHEIPQEIGDFGVLIYAGLSKAKALVYNLFSALTAVLGAVLTLLIAVKIQGIEFCLLAVAAGGFIYIAGSDLIPELQKERDFRKSAAQLFFVLLGIGIMALLLLI